MTERIEIGTGGGVVTHEGNGSGLTICHDLAGRVAGAERIVAPDAMVTCGTCLRMAEAQSPGPGSLVCVPCGNDVGAFLEQVPGKLPNGDVCTHRTGKVGKHPSRRRIIPQDTTP